MKILIIEDEQEIAQSIVNYFKTNNIQCETGGNYALARTKIDNYDCIILDLILPDGDRFDILRELKSKNIGLVIIKKITKINQWKINYTFDNLLHRFSVTF